MILWKDFVIDDQLGPYLFCCEAGADSASIMEDARDGQIQETRQEQQPARMVGLSSLDSSARNDRDVVPRISAQALQRGGNG